MKQITQNGFTIVEIIVVIAVIGILAGAGTLSFGAYQNNIQAAAVKSDLSSAAGKMESDRTFEGGYPATITTVFTASDLVQLSGGKLTDATFCLDGQSKKNATIQYYIDNLNRERGAQAGTCATRPNSAVPAITVGFTVSPTSATQATGSWTATGGATSYTLQCATDAAYIIGMKSIVITAPTVTGVVSGLSPASGYYCHVRAINAVGPGPWSDTKSTVTTT